MRAQAYTFMLCIVSLICGLSAPSFARPTPWAGVTAPVPGPAEAIGGYANGCLVGAEALPADGYGFHSIRRWRKRFYGHPETIQFVRQFARDFRDQMPKEATVLIGDIGQMRGGLASSGHRSHQMGLDVDIWFTHPREGLDKDDFFPSMVDARTERVRPEVFGDRQGAMLKMAAQDERVARIFVHWGIKAYLCEHVQGDRAWLHKIRAWYGHDRHFHVRLTCPLDSPDCHNQSTLSPGDACGEERWFSRAQVAKRKRAERRKKRARRGKRSKRDTVHVGPPSSGGSGGSSLQQALEAQARRCPEVLAMAPGGVVPKPKAQVKKRAPAKKRAAAKRAPAKKKAPVKRAPAKKKAPAKRAPAKRTAPTPKSAG